MAAESRSTAPALTWCCVVAVSVPSVSQPPKSEIMTDFNNKLLTSTRNSNLIVWDLDKPGSIKYSTCRWPSACVTHGPAERKTKNHIHSIHITSSSVSPSLFSLPLLTPPQARPSQASPPCSEVCLIPCTAFPALTLPRLSACLLSS